MKTGPRAALLLLLASTSLVAAASCSSSSNGGTGTLGGGGGAPYTCSTGQMAVNASYAEELAGSGTCDKPPLFLTGTTAAGGSCSDVMACAPSCCVCPAGTGSSGRQVLISACGSTCAGAAEACCSDYLFAICNAGAADAGAG